MDEAHRSGLPNLEAANGDENGAKEAQLESVYSHVIRRLMKEKKFSLATEVFLSMQIAGILAGPESTMALLIDDEVAPRYA